MTFYISLKRFLDNGILSHGVSLDIPGYNLVKVDHPGITKRDGVCIWFRDYLLLRILDIFSSRTYKLWNNNGDKVCKFISLYGDQTNLLKNSNYFQAPWA